MVFAIAASQLASMTAYAVMSIVSMMFPQVVGRPWPGDSASYLSVDSSALRGQEMVTVGTHRTTASTAVFAGASLACSFRLSAAFSLIGVWIFMVCPVVMGRPWPVIALVASASVQHLPTQLTSKAGHCDGV